MVLIETAVRGIRELPLAWPHWPRRQDVRIRTLHDYPYSIAYLVDDDGAILLLAIAHQRRRPGYWLRRVPGSSTLQGG